MKSVEPIVLKLSQTTLNFDAMDELLVHFHASDHARNAFMDKRQRSDEETLIELAGRMCYRSFEPGLNPNVTKIRADSEEYFANILKKGDGSILEHIQVSFAFLNVSRVFTHELVRHRVGTAISQESMRYVRPRDIGFWLPEGLTSEQKERMLGAVRKAEEVYHDLEDTTDWENMSFDQKKVMTSAFRRILPDGMSTNIIWSANLRTLRHVIEMRTSEAAEVEIRYVFDKVAQICKRDYPLVFQDFTRRSFANATGVWTPSLRSKV